MLLLIFNFLSLLTSILFFSLFVLDLDSVFVYYFYILEVFQGWVLGLYSCFLRSILVFLCM